MKNIPTLSMPKKFQPVFLIGNKAIFCQFFGRKKGSIYSIHICIHWKRMKWIFYALLIIWCINCTLINNWSITKENTSLTVIIFSVEYIIIRVADPDILLRYGSSRISHRHNGRIRSISIWTHNSVPQGFLKVLILIRLFQRVRFELGYLDIRSG